MKVHFQALGCRLNEAELETWSNEFIDKGYQLASNSEEADLVIFNSCSVTAEADRKSRKFINRLQKSNPQSRLIVTGCYASLQEQRVKTQLGVDLVVPNQNKEGLVDQVIQQFDLKPDDSKLSMMDKHSLFVRGRHRAFIKVQDGCRYRCTFCIVTVARGDERSRDHHEIIKEINHHHRQGVHEIVITGVHVGGYGSDIGSSLYQLISEILDKTTIPRIRLASVEPWDLPDNFFELFQDGRLMPHMHLPLQSGSDSVLRRMARRCKTAEFERLAETACSRIPGFNITTDLIVGFPGETEQEWAETMRFVERVGFGHIHVFSYSPREGTKAARLTDQIPDQVKKQRNQEMHKLARELKSGAMKEMVGARVEVLWESNLKSDPEKRIGYTPQFHKITAAFASGHSPDLSTVNVMAVDDENLTLIADNSP